MKRFGPLACLLITTALGGCSLMHSSQPTAQQRAGVVPGKTITVTGNQNIYAIAQEQGVSMRDIIILNNLHEPFAVKSGQTLVMPFKRGEGEVASSTSGESGPAISGTMEPAPSASIQSEELPPPVTAAPVSNNLAPAAQPLTAQGLNRSKPLGTGQVDALNSPSLTQQPRTVTTTAAPTGAAAVVSAVHEETSSSSSAPSMVWPVQGPLLSGFGPKGQGVNNDGVNIGAPKGSPVVAAASGVVVYAGNEMKGFGNLVLIRHEGGWVTAYAYLDRVLVAKDATVAQGDMIGTVGKTGNVASPQLHFETRHGGKPVDPNGVIKS